MEAKILKPTESALCILALCMPKTMRAPGFPPNPEPLSLHEYNQFALSLHKAGLRPEQLFSYITSSTEDGPLKDCAKLAGIEYKRIVKLVSTIPDCRKIMERWSESHHIWIIGRGDPEYPRRFKSKLGWNAPAFLFGIGNRSILNEERCISVVGSHKISPERAIEAQKIGERIAQENFHLVFGSSGDSDRAVAKSAFEAIRTQNLNSGILGILSNNLAEHSEQKEWIDHGIHAHRIRDE